ncbi:ATP-binding protein [Bradyrhizobium japonicum]|uniref:ATP-binding protein n=1 Tax=Bradyrhizobium japonicum TaxID=375 RepID=UPI000413254C|nr:ATP-binding protein [Bradyrhizobium japonicum]WLB91311.1 ATP-binding protein [Bradyrhizobium japonicum USDA 135]
MTTVLAFKQARLAPGGLPDALAVRTELRCRRELDELDADEERALDELELQLAGSLGEPLRRIASVFRLSQIEIDVLTTTVAATVDPDLGALFERLLAPGGRAATDALISRLFAHPPGRVFDAAGPLAAWGLVTARPHGWGLPHAFVADPVLPFWLAGDARLDPVSTEWVRAPRHGAFPSRWPVAATASALRAQLDRGMSCRVIVRGSEGEGRERFSAAVAAAVGLHAIAADVGAIEDEAWPPVYMHVQRFAAVTAQAVIWRGAARRRWPMAPAPVQFIVASRHESIAPLNGVIDSEVALTPLTASEADALFTEAVPAAAAWNAEARGGIAACGLDINDIDQLALIQPAAPEDALNVLRRRHRAPLDPRLRRLDTPYGFNDLVLPPATLDRLHALAFEAAHHDEFWGGNGLRQMFQREASLLALFAGPSGTGKTMSAQVLARELGRELLRADLGGMMSKYIGDTAKNLTEVCAIAGECHAILLFDEADTLFARRTEVKDAHDRYANADTNHLLALVETYQGIAVLCTNRRGDVDPSFMRRLRHIIDYPQPDRVQRTALWRSALKALDVSALQRVAPVIDDLAESVDVSGAQIKSAVVTAAFAARRAGEAFDVKHVAFGLAREIEKDGRTLSPQDWKRLVNHG